MEKVVRWFNDEANPDASERISMCDLNELEALLREESSGLQNRIIQDIGIFTVALFGVFGTQDRLELGGTGTLVTIADRHYILTAAHVWDRVLRRAAQVGITLKENIDHQFLIETQSTAPFGPPWPNLWNEWGPDLILLRIPQEYVGSINAYRGFYNLTKEKEAAPAVNSLETYVLMGTPEASGEFTQTHADIEINGQFMQAEPTHQVQGGFDFFDFEVDVSLPGVPQSFGGVSGGGLWRVRVYWQESSGEICWHRTLEGVAFHQSDLVSGHRVIRCHAQQSIRSAAAYLHPTDHALRPNPDLGN